MWDKRQRRCGGHRGRIAARLSRCLSSARSRTPRLYFTHRGTSGSALHHGNSQAAVQTLVERLNTGGGGTDAIEAGGGGTEWGWEIERDREWDV